MVEQIFDVSVPHFLEQIVIRNKTQINCATMACGSGLVMDWRILAFIVRVLNTLGFQLCAVEPEG